MSNNRAVPRLSPSRLAAKFKVGYTDEKEATFLDNLKTSTNYSPILPCIIPVIFIALLVFPISFVPFPSLDNGFLYHGIMPIFCLVTSFLGSTATVHVAEYFVPECKFSRRNYFISGSAGAIAFVATMMILTQFCYPYPFSISIATNCAIPFMCATMWVQLRKVKHLPTFWKSFKAFLLCHVIIWFIFLIYPASVQVLRLIQETEFGTDHAVVTQLSFATFLFTLRRVFKLSMIQVSEGADRPAPLVAVLIVNGYHTVYLSIILQNLIGWSTLIFITAGDVAGLLVDYNHMKSVNKLIKPGELSTGDVDSYYSMTVDMSESVADNSQETRVGDSEVTVPVESTTTTTLPRTDPRKIMLLLAENFVMIEYIECIIPMLLAIFSLLVSEFSWNREYILLFEDMDDSEMVEAQRLLWAYAFSEIIILAIVIPIFIGRLNFPFWKHLGFVLTENRNIIVGLVSLWLLQTIASSVKHLHTDWNFDCAAPP